MKNAGVPFTPDVDDKQASATPALHAAAQQHLNGLYARLETLRAERS